MAAAMAVTITTMVVAITIITALLLGATIILSTTTRPTITIMEQGQSAMAALLVATVEVLS